MLNTYFQKDFLKNRFFASTIKNMDELSHILMLRMLLFEHILSCLDFYDKLTIKAINVTNSY